MPRHCNDLIPVHRRAPTVTPAPAQSRPRETQRLPDARSAAPSVWLRVAQAAGRAQCGRKSIYDAVRAGRLRAARIGRRALRFRPEWVDSWLEATATRSDVAERVESWQVA